VLPAELSSPREEHAEPSVRPSAWLVLGLALGLVSGYAEVAFQAARHYILDHWVRLGPHTLWMAPLAQAILLGFLGILAGVAWQARPGRRTGLVILGTLAWIAVLPELLSQPWIDTRAAALVGLGFSVQAARLAIKRLDRLLQLARRALPILAVSLGLAAAAVPLGLAWRERRLLARHASAEGHPSVLLIILDTVRAASLSVYGYSRPTTPFLEVFAREGALFQKAYSASSWTLPSHASMLTGHWPHEVSADWNTPLDRRYPTLAEYFTNAGYATGAFVSNYVYTRPESGRDRGFIRSEAFRVTPAEVVASSSIARWLADLHWVRRVVGSQDVLNRKLTANVRQDFLRWMGGLRGRPFFAMLNIFDAHEPYLPPAPFDTLFGDGRISFHPKTIFTQRSVALNEDTRLTLPAAELERQKNAYDGALRYIDTQLRVLIEELRRRGVLDEIVVVITSDHGEGFGEGGEFMHGNLFSDLTTHVPLLVRFPRVVPAGRVISQEVSLRDLPSTLAGLAGFSVPADSIPGHPLVDLLRSPSSSDAGVSPAFSSFWAWKQSGARNWSLVRSGLRYLVSDKGKESLFDLRSDPYEVSSLLERPAPEIRDSAKAFRSVIDSIRTVTITSPRPNPWTSK
jgi:arylsulfatase A-like enzyme